MTDRWEQFGAGKDEDLSSPEKVLETLAKVAPARAAYLIPQLVRIHRDEAYIRGYNEGIENANFFICDRNRK